MAIYWPIPGFKGRMFKLCVLTRWDFNFCIRSSPLWGCATTDDCVYWAMPTDYNTWLCPLGYAYRLQHMTVSTGLSLQAMSDCVHWAMYYNRWLSTKLCATNDEYMSTALHVLQQMTASIGLCTTTYDCVHWAMYNNQRLSTELYSMTDDSVHSYMCCIRWLCPLSYSACYNRQVCVLNYVLYQRLVS